MFVVVVSLAGQRAIGLLGAGTVDDCLADGGGFSTARAVASRRRYGSCRPLPATIGSST